MFWQSETRVEKVADVMTGNMWESVKNHLHLNNNDNIVGNNDKLYKLRPLIDALLGKFNSIQMDEKLCVDEQIIPFKGKHSMKVYMQNKPKKVALQMFYDV